VYNATAGVFETSKLSGHLKDPKVHNLGRTKFVPMSPAVMFGAYFRPRADKTVSVVGATRVGGTASNKAVVPAWPEGLSDQKTFFKAAFKRVPNARPVAVPYEDVPPGAAVAVNSQLQLLLPATGPGNAYEIVRQAEILAYGAIGKKHVRIPSQTFVVARPWPVNCDGVVASATIKMRDGQAGFTTTIETGDEPIEVVRPYQTRQRRRRGDAAKREGLTD
ncbi:MAG: hypothetical protein VW362_12975, partial [Candidatus Nanopelagicales bacterium]